MIGVEGDFERLRVFWIEMIDALHPERSVVEAKEWTDDYLHEMTQILGVSKDKAVEIIGASVEPNATPVRLLVTAQIKEHPLFEKYYKPLIKKCNYDLGFVSVDSDGTVRVFSEDGAELTGYTADNVFIFSGAEERAALIDFFGNRVIQFDPSSVSHWAGFIPILLALRELQKENLYVSWVNNVFSVGDGGVLQIKTAEIAARLSEAFQEQARRRMIEMSA